MNPFKKDPVKQAHKMFWRAMNCKNVEDMRTAISLGVDVNLTNEHNTPLAYMVEQGKIEAVRLLLQSGADVDGRHGDHQWTALMSGAWLGRVKCAEVLLEHGAAVEVRSQAGKTALHIAAEEGYADFVTLLLQHGADPLVQDNAMNTPADLAEKKKHTGIANRLRGQRTPKEIERTLRQEWILTAPDEVSRVVERKLIGYRLTDIFNFGLRTHTHIAHNLDTGVESNSFRNFSDIAEAPVLQQAADALVRLGGNAEVAQLALARHLEKPLMLKATGA